MPVREHGDEQNRMSVMRRCEPVVLVLDNDGQPTEVVQSRHSQDVLDCYGVKMAEYVPAEQLRGAVEALREIAEGGYTGDNGKRYRYSGGDLKQIAEEALRRFGGQ
jgi:hypothetical protein